MRPFVRALVPLVAAALVWPSAPALAAPDATGRPSKLPALTPGPRDALTFALEGGAIGPARYALERFASAVAPGAVSPTFRDRIARPGSRSATLLARDLVVRLPSLGPADRARARALLARPTDGFNDPDLPFGVDGGYTVDEATPLCGTEICVHYVTTTANKVPVEPSAGGDPLVPDYVETVAAVLEDVWDFEIGDLGYREPKPDGASANDGGDGRFDVYLTNLGDDGLYGYCTSDDPNLFGGYRYFDFSAYCVLDNDYAAAEFGYADVTLPLRVTAAHEFFHAVQFAYDLYEDGWLLEATATWMEDEKYDDIDDNRQYLSTSPLSNPTVPLDKTSGLRVYGDWIFFRFLSEYLGSASSGGTDDRAVVRKIWEKADGSSDGPDQFSSQAVMNVVDNEQRGGVPWTFAKAFRDFGAWNLAPATFYSEGSEYTPGPVQVSKVLKPSTSPVKNTGQIDHLAHRFVRIVRGDTVGAGARLRVSVDGPDAVTRPVATLVIVADDGGVTTKTISLNGKGAGSATIDFGSGVRRAIVALGNASVRYTGCYDFFGPFACNGGDPVDDDLSFKVSAKLV